MNALRVDELKREIAYSVGTGAIRIKSNCPHCYERGIEGFSNGGEPVLCRCLEIDHTLLAKQNRGELEQREPS